MREEAIWARNTNVQHQHRRIGDILAGSLYSILCRYLFGQHAFNRHTCLRIRMGFPATVALPVINATNAQRDNEDDENDNDEGLDASEDEGSE